MFSHDQMPQVPVFSQLLIPLIQEILHPAGDMFGLGGGVRFPASWVNPPVPGEDSDVSHPSWVFPTVRCADGAALHIQLHVSV